MSYVYVVGCVNGETVPDIKSDRIIQLIILDCMISGNHENHQKFRLTSDDFCCALHEFKKSAIITVIHKL